MLVQQAEANLTSNVAQSKTVHFEDELVGDMDKWEEAGKYILNREGNLHSKLVGFTDRKDKPQRWLIVESEEEGMPEPNRGVLVCDMDKGKGIYRSILDALEIKYEVKGKEGKTVDFILPYYFYADWSRGDKAIGTVRISNITLNKPAQAV